MACGHGHRKKGKEEGEEEQKEEEEAFGDELVWLCGAGVCVGGGWRSELGPTGACRARCAACTDSLPGGMAHWNVTRTSALAGGQQIASGRVLPLGFRWLRGS